MKKEPWRSPEIIALFYDLNNKIVREINGKHDDVLHFGNFIEAIRSGEKLKSDIEDGQKSTLLCHLGNIAWRTGHTINFDPAKKQNCRRQVCVRALESQLSARLGTKGLRLSSRINVIRVLTESSPYLRTAPALQSQP